MQSVSHCSSLGRSRVERRDRARLHSRVDRRKISGSLSGGPNENGSASATATCKPCWMALVSHGMKSVPLLVLRQQRSLTSW